MHPLDERNWLTWLVKVRILILMVLLAIELAVIRLTPSPLPIVPFLTGMVLWFVLSLFSSSWFRCGTNTVCSHLRCSPTSPWLRSSFTLPAASTAR